MKMPWGKYDGEDMEDIPISYLKWLEENCDDEEIRVAAEDEVIRRRDHHEL